MTPRLAAAALAAAALLGLAGPASAASQGRSVAAHAAHRPHTLLWPMCWVNGNGAAHWKWRGDELVRHCYRR